MKLKKLDYELTVCKVPSEEGFDLSRPFYFIGRTDEEFSLVCRTEDAPANTLEREDGWRGFRIQGVLDFSLIGILSKISGILAEKKDEVAGKIREAGFEIVEIMEEDEWVCIVAR